MRQCKKIKEVKKLVTAIKNKRRGRPSINEETKDLVVRLYNEDTMTCMQIAKACNISKASVFRIINERRQMHEEE